MIVLDTTVLAYAIGDDHPLREPCRRLIAAHADGRFDGATTVEVIQEFAHIQARRRTRTVAIDLAIPGLRWIDPATPDLESVIRA